jgi:hypothetical protein
MAFFRGPFKEYGFAYEYGGSTFSQIIVASSAEEAIGRVHAMVNATFSGELKLVSEGAEKQNDSIHPAAGWIIDLSVHQIAALVQSFVRPSFDYFTNVIGLFFNTGFNVATNASMSPCVGFETKVCCSLTSISSNPRAFNEFVLRANQFCSHHSLRGV